MYIVEIIDRALNAEKVEWPDFNSAERFAYAMKKLYRGRGAKEILLYYEGQFEMSAPLQGIIQVA